MRGVRHGIERDFAFEHFVSQGLSMQPLQAVLHGIAQSTGFSLHADS
jgi:hypothetical protein